MTRVALSMRSTVSMFDAGYSIATIQQGLKEEEVIVIKQNLYPLIKKLKEKGVCTALLRRVRDRKLSSLKNVDGGYSSLPES